MKDTTINLLEINNFLKEKYKYHMLFKIIQSDEKIVYTDHENYVMAQSAIGYPLWIWTVDDIKTEKLHEVLNLLEIFFDNDELKITCKEDLYYKIKDMYDISTYFEMGFLQCKKLTHVKKSKGFLDKPNYSDKITLANYWIDLCKEDNNVEISLHDALIEVSHWLSSDNFYVWRNSLGKVVSIASYNVINDQARISHVYTPKEERRKGYCKSLIYEMTEEILALNLVPLLYTNYNYAVSNDLYKKLGFEPKGYLITFQLKK